VSAIGRRRANAVVMEHEAKICMRRERKRSWAAALDTLDALAAVPQAPHPTVDEICRTAGAAAA
jgi:hypothetical protein